MRERTDRRRHPRPQGTLLAAQAARHFCATARAILPLGNRI
jgi:hypothetical protein